jgi:hypothetical protein
MTAGEAGGAGDEGGRWHQAARDNISGGRR